MKLEVASFVVAVVSAIITLWSVPSLQPWFGRVQARVPAFTALINVFPNWFLPIPAIATACMSGLAVYYYLFYPCPWYQVSALRTKFDDYRANQQWSYVEDIGQQLCDCGKIGEGWDVQARAAYHARQYEKAIDFWKRAIRADPDVGHNIKANIADAQLQLNEFVKAEETYKALHESEPENLHFRYGYGRASVFNGHYAEALQTLNGMPDSFDDGGSAGEVLIFEAAAHFGRADSNDKLKTQDLAEGQRLTCQAISMSDQWRSLISDKNSDEGHFSKVRPLFSQVNLPAC